MTDPETIARTLSERGAEVAELAARATPGPWRLGADLWTICAPNERGLRGFAATIVRTTVGKWAKPEEHLNNLELIAHVPAMASLISDQARTIAHQSAELERMGERVKELEVALELFARLEIPAKPTGNAGFFSIPFSRIAAARAALNPAQMGGRGMSAKQDALDVLRAIEANLIADCERPVQVGLLREFIESAGRNSARYEWIAAHAEAIQGLNFDWHAADGNSKWGEHDPTLDAAIDAALAARNGGDL